jgi:hypothetical protein
MSRPHQPGEDRFVAILPEQIPWKNMPGYPAYVHLAVVVGDPSLPAPYTVRVKVPLDGKLMPHRHHEDRVYTVISGIFYIGFGDKFDGDTVTAYPPGTTLILPGDTWHFHWAKSGEYVTQVSAIGPLSVEYADRADDPRQAATERHATV